MNKTLTREYERDYYAWLTANADLLRRGDLNAIDAEHIAEELEAMGRRERRELVNRLTVLLIHLLKWQYRPARRSRSWRNTLLIQRSDLLELLADSPSLQQDVVGSIARAYERAKLLAEEEMGLDKSLFPAQCPYRFEDIVSLDFFPAASTDVTTAEEAEEE